MTKDKNPSILNDALKDIQDIVETAKKNVHNSIEEMMPQKFDALVKEEINRIKNKESAKDKVDESTKKDEKNKTSKKINEDLDMGLTQQPETGEDDIDFDNINFEDIEAELSGDTVKDDLDQAEELRQESENMSEMENTNDPYERIKKIQEMVNEMMAEMDKAKVDQKFGGQFETYMREMYGDGYKNNLGEEKCGELYEMFVAHKNGNPFGDKKVDTVNEAEEAVEEMKEVGGLSGPDQNKGNENEAGGPKPQTIDEKDEELEDKRSEKEEEREEDEEVDESKAHGYSHSAQKTAGSETTDGKSYAENNNLFRYAINKSKSQNESLVQKLKSALEENKKLTKKFVDSKSTIKKLEESNKILEEGTKKARKLLGEMAIFNTNLSNVNNILVNEDVKDKQEIIKKFDSANTIEESEKIYKSIISEMKKTKTSITEDIERKVTGNSTGTSSKNILESKEVKQQTAYTNLDKIKRNMFYESAKK